MEGECACEEIIDAGLNLSSTSKGQSTDLARPLYSKLAKWQMRLLNLQPGLFHEPLVADLVVADLVDLDGTGVALHNEVKHVDYEVISYT